VPQAEVRADVIVVGLGAVGIAIAYQLGRRGVDFIGIDRHSPPHVFGSSHGESRITREFVGEGAAYIPLAKRSHAIWATLEAEGHRLRERTGVLYLARRGLEAQRHGPGDFMRRTAAAAEACGVALAELTADEIRRAWPQFNVTDDTFGYLEPDAGFVRPELCIQAQLEGIANRDAALKFGETVLEVAKDGDGVRVTTDRAAYRARKAVLAMGAWLPDFAGGRYRRDLQVFRQVQFWFRPKRPDLWRQDAAPAFLWFHGRDPADVFYGFPMLEGGAPGVKLATEQYVEACDPDTVSREVPKAESDAMFGAHVRGRLVGVTGERVHAAACLYTFNTRAGHEGEFIIADHPDVPGVTAVSACSGHGFKHSAAVGESIAQTLAGEPPECDLSPFRL
jgi:sarcosine oxidase